MKELDFIYKRHSVRKFKNQTVPVEDLRQIIKAATYAPSGKNKQNWHFVVVTNADKIAEIAHIVERKNAQLAHYLTEEQAKKFTETLSYQTVFKNAPTIILVYAGFYGTIADDLIAAKMMDSREVVQYTKPNPGIQNIAAAMENLQLAAANLGYGTCWMTGPTYASEEISAYIGFSQAGFYLAAVTPIGLPVQEPAGYPKRKSVDEVTTWIE